jgi:hypothetical protein
VRGKEVTQFLLRHRGRRGARSISRADGLLYDYLRDRALARALLAGRKGDRYA